MEVSNVYSVLSVCRNYPQLREWVTLWVLNAIILVIPKHENMLNKISYISALDLCSSVLISIVFLLSQTPSSSKTSKL